MHRMTRVLAPAVLVATAVLAFGAPAPTPDKLRQVVRDYFAKVPGYREGDLIDQAQVEAAMQELKAAGFQFPQAQQIVSGALRPSDWLVVELRRPSGLLFMRRIAKYPGAYDRLDRLSVMPHGKQTIRDLVRGPDGDKMLEYLTKEKGGKQLGRMLSRTPTGVHFNRPTGRVYTAAALVEELTRALEPVKAPGGST